MCSPSWKLLYKVVLVSANHQHESATGTCMSPLCWISLPPPPLPSPLGCYRAGVWVPWVKQQIPVGYLFYIWQCKFPCYSLHIAWILRGTISSMSPNSGNVPLEGFCYHFETRANNSWQWNSSPRPGILPLKNQFSSVAQSCLTLCHPMHIDKYLLKVFPMIFFFGFPFCLLCWGFVVYPACWNKGNPGV